MSDAALHILRSGEVPQRLLRYLIASPGGLELDHLTDLERSAADELVRAGCASIAGSIVLCDRSSPAVEQFMREYGSGVDGADDTRQLLAYLQTLTAAIGNCASVSDLFRSAFRNLVNELPFDSALAVTVEQNLLLYVTRRENAAPEYDESVIEQVRSILEQNLSVSFHSTDAVLQGDFGDLPARDLAPSESEQRLLSLLRLENRPAGVLVLTRFGSPFAAGEQRLLDFFANQVSLLLGTVRAQEQIQNLADTDEMTGIWNRRYFRRQLDAEVERARIYKLPLSLMTFDVDSFKEINDTFGHPMGDVVLSELCGIVRESLRQPDLFARIGGDEFAIILPHTDGNGAHHLAERILKKVRRMLIPGDANTSVTCSVSIGIASYVPHETSAEELMRRADEQLYVAKKTGKNRYA